MHIATELRHVAIENLVQLGSLSSQERRAVAQFVDLKRLLGTMYNGRVQPKLLSRDDLDILRGWGLSKRAEIHLQRSCAATALASVASRVKNHAPHGQQ